MSFHSLMTLNHDDKTPVPPSITEPVPFGSISDNFPMAHASFVAGDTPTYGHRNVNPSDFFKAQKDKPFDFVATPKLNMPKAEPVSYGQMDDTSTTPFKFVSKSSDPVLSLRDPKFLRLPDSCSVENVHDEFELPESAQKRVKSFFQPADDDPYTLESILRRFQASKYSAVCNPAVAVQAPAFRAPRRRPNRISEKIGCLQKLLPWDKKMDTTRMLEEAYKYIRFLEAQVTTLHSMPCGSSLTRQNPSGSDNDLFGGLGRLNRQQALEAMVNSPAAQTAMYSQGICVYSVEQLVLLAKMAERNAFDRQMLLDPVPH
ncbi:hypothetical protein RJ639_039016 [Escallonia herrerae]|uniref:BHLH domain-containing protein n=1 Tax=Escallonia herrerae TaxID=1293975 RepID=A0AA89B3S9_9ASTE|nr:hypothetical protein RJ639_039016 [Escallonia herrerae]